MLESCEDWVKLGYLTYTAMLANLLGLAVWCLDAPFTLTTLGAYLALGYAISYKIDEKEEEEIGDLLLDYAC